MPPSPRTAVFADLPDPRRDTKNKLHPLGDIPTIAACAVIAGADTWGDIAEYGRTKGAFLRRFLDLPHGVPSPGTFERVFAKLDPAAVARAFGRWMAAVGSAAGLIPVAIDGKSARSAPASTATGRPHLSVRGRPRPGWSQVRWRWPTGQTRWPRSPSCFAPWT
jgi:hypothetical protein